MYIEHLKTNHLENPLGYRLDYLLLSWEVLDTDAITDKWTRVQIAQDEGFQTVLYDSGRMENYGYPYHRADFVPRSASRYYWRVEIETDKGEYALSGKAWFETALPEGAWPARWISPQKEEEAMPCLYKDFTVNEKIRKARLYCCGLGLYECYLDRHKIGEEFLLPGYHSYDLMNQYQTFDVTELLHVGENRLSFILGEGWYKGRFVFEGGYENLYGDRKLLLAMLVMEKQDGSEERILTDETWKAVQTGILSNNIYDGEVIDKDRKRSMLPLEVVEGPAGKLMPRLNVPLHKAESHAVKEIIRTASGELVLDFGEAITGWVEVYGDGPMDFTLQYSEHMQEGEIYRDNLRTAKAEFKYRGRAEKEWIRPHFTYYGFRYVLVKGMEEIKREDFTAYRIMSDIGRTGSIRTSNDKVNRLFENTVRSQKCNFIDIPLDCPQRDERMGWTGDIAVFAGTGSFHMYTPAFLHHYMMNLQLEQSLLDGAVPFFVPKPKPAVHEGINPFLVTAGACTWGDAATIVPWELYLHYKDKDMLALHYPVMCSWTQYMTGRAGKNKNPRLWQNDRQLGDWLALDNGDIHNPIGSTDSGFIASAYYYYSTVLCQRAAKALGRTDDFEKWKTQAVEIRRAFIGEYMDESGELVGNKTQTAYAMALYLGLYDADKKQALVDGLQRALKECGNHLNTGFVGTSMLMQALSDNGLLKEAYTLLLQEDYPSWLREVKLGATTIWERWNSVNGDGTICNTGMNSLNHYAYGCVAGWMYEAMCGFRWNEEDELYLKPMPDARFKEVEGVYRTVYGSCSVKWSCRKAGKVKLTIRVAFQAQVTVELPWGETKTLEAGVHFFEGLLP